MPEVDLRTEREPRASHRGQQHQRHRGDAGGGAEAECPAEPVVRQHVGEIPGGRPGVRERQQRRDDDQVRQDRAPGGSEEPASAVQECIGESGEAIEEDLDQEDSGECGADRPVQVVVDILGDVDRVEPEDQRGGQHRDGGEPGHEHDRHRDHHVGGLVVVLLDERREQRNERCRQQSAEQQVVDDVRGLVGEEVGVAQRRLAEHIGEHGDPEQTGDARDRRAAGNDDVAAQQSTHPSERYFQRSLSLRHPNAIRNATRNATRKAIRKATRKATRNSESGLRWAACSLRIRGRGWTQARNSAPLSRSVQCSLRIPDGAQGRGPREGTTIDPRVKVTGSVRCHDHHGCRSAR